MALKLNLFLDIVNLENKDAEEMKFVTDERYCGRGFNAIYEHIPCQNGEPPQNACSRLLRENSFILEIFDYNEPMCRITIKKNDSVSTRNTEWSQFTAPIYYFRASVNYS